MWEFSDLITVKYKEPPEEAGVGMQSSLEENVSAWQRKPQTITTLSQK